MVNNFESFSGVGSTLNTAPDLLLVEVSFQNQNGLSLVVDTDLEAKFFTEGDSVPRLVSTLTSSNPSGFLIEGVIRASGIFYIVRADPNLFDDNKLVRVEWRAKVGGVEFSPYPLVQHYVKNKVRENILLSSEVMQWVKLELGFPVVSLEVTEPQLVQAIENALRTYNQYVPKYRFGVIQLVAGQNRYPIPNVGRGIVRVDFIRREGLPLVCYTGDTCVKLLDGTVKTMKELYDEYHGTGKGFWVYSYDVENKTIVPGWAHDIDIIQRNAPIVEVILDDDTKIRCTAGNKFMLADGSMIEAERLKPGDSLMPLYTRFQNLIKNGTDKDKEYEQCYLPEVGEWEFTHRLVARYKYKDQLELLRAQGKQVIHHINYNRFDNRPENLVFWSINEMVEEVSGSKEYIRLNHKVKVVIFVGYEDVYDFVVDKYHNFAVGGKSQQPNNGSELQQKAGGWSWVFGSNSDPLFGR